MAREWREDVARRTRTSKTTRLHADGQPTNKYSWDGIVGTSLHYEEVEGSGEWLEVDPRIVPSSEPGWDWEMVNSHWRFLARNGGWFAAEKQGVGIGFRLERIAYLNIQTKEWQTIRTANYTTPTVTDIEHGNDLLANPLGKLTWTDLFPNVDFEIHVSGDRLHEEIKVSQAARDAMPAPPYPAADTYLVMVYRVDWGQVPGLADDDGDVDYDADFERQGRLLLKTHQGEIITALPASRAWPEGHPVDEDGEPIEVPLRKRFVKVGGQHYLLVGAPVLALKALPQGTVIFDPDIHEQVEAGDDNAREDNDETNFVRDPDLDIVSNEEAADAKSVGARFTTVDIAQGSTIENGTYLKLTCKFTSLDDINCVIYGHDADNALDFFDNPHIISQIDRPRTTASVPWVEDSLLTAGSNSPEAKAVVHEIFNRPSWVANNALVILFIANEDVYKYCRCYEWGSDPDKAIQLHIVYTAGNGGATVEAVVATATAAALLATITAGASVSGEPATATAEALVPTVSGGIGVTVTAVVATATAAGLVAVVTGGTGATVSAVVAEAAASALLATVTGGATVSAEIATATAEALIPVVTGDEGVAGQVDAVTATAEAAALLPTITGGAIVLAVVATATAEALAPQIIIGTVLTGTPIALSRALVEYVLSNGLLAAAEADLYEVPVFRQAVLLLLILHNIHETNSNDLFLFVKPVDESSVRVAKKTLAAGETAFAEADVDEELVLNTGDKIRAYATNADQVTWTVSMKERVRV